MKELPKSYEAKNYEADIYRQWEQSGYFNPDNLPGDGEPFSIAMPPPNATGTLHLGHSTMVAIQDLMVRFERLRGKKVLWLPGTDHAAIATQNVVEKKVFEEQKKTRFDFSREEFVDKVSEFAENSRQVIRNQIRAVGASCDWSRERYTLDEGLSKAVREVFVRMYNDGLIYRGSRIVNWCYRCGTTLADDEVEYKEQKSKFYYLKYGPLVIGTARPETKVLDKVIIVHPEDDRYKKYIGQEFDVPWIDGNVKAKVVADPVAEMEIGTGAMTITPAHSFVDFELAQKYGFDVVEIIGPDGKLTQQAGKFAGLNVKEARKAIVEELQAKGLVERIDESYVHNLSVCYRCGTPVEPIPSKQWFVGVEREFSQNGKSVNLKQLAIDAVRSGQIKIIPERFEKTYFNWIENLHDWCISRQIWFGHRIPVWYCMRCSSDYCLVIYLKKFLNIKELKNVFLITTKQLRNDFIAQYADSWRDKIDKIQINECNKEDNLVSTNNPGSCPRCGYGDLVQDPDTLDTWFSSGLWTFSTLGWPEQTKDLQAFHPTSVMETGYDILFFWVARMILMSRYSVGQIPFRTVYLHGLVRDKLGRKMSKSLGNGIDPLQMIEKYGADALRLSLIIGTTPGNDSKLYEEKIAGYRNFVNKLWNISRYVLLTIQNATPTDKVPNSLTLADKWILSRFTKIVAGTTLAIQEFRFSEAGEALYDFTWHELADWYLEIAKVEGSKDEILSYLLTQLLKLWHPFTPYVTEVLWHEAFKGERLLMVEVWPTELPPVNNEAEKELSIIRDVVIALRNYRAENKLSNDVILNCKAESHEWGEVIKRHNKIIEELRTKVQFKEQLGEEVINIPINNLEINLLLSK